MRRTDRTLNCREQLDPKTENLLWQLSDVPAKATSGASEPIDSEELERYRQGKMSVDECHCFEKRLATNERAIERTTRAAARPPKRRKATLRLVAWAFLGGLATAELLCALQTGDLETPAVEVPPYTATVQELAARRGAEPEASHAGQPRSTVRFGTATEGTELSWEFYAAPCPDAVSLYSTSCGAYGELHFDVVSSNCRPFDSGSEQPLGYPGREFKHPPEWEPKPGSERRVGQGGRSLPGTAPKAGPWGALIDWQDAHGAAVGAVADALSGTKIPTVAYYLDAPDLLVLGSQVGDQHLLVTLCAVAEDVDINGAVDLKTLGLSLGRVTQPTDPPSAGSCQGSLGCQIEGVLSHLRDRNVTVVAAAGNHQELLFPALLDETLAVGALDFGEYLKTGLQRAAWESPTQFDALLPGHGLCVGATTAPSGSSFSTAFLAGGLARLLEELPGIDPYSGELWKTQWSSREGCMVLAQGGTEHPYCNGELEDILGGLIGSTSGGCWDAPTPALVAIAAPAGSSVPRPPVLGLAQWVADKLTAAPEEDPCIPCTDDDSYPPFASALFLNLTRSMPLSEFIHLDSLYLRAGESFYPIDLTPVDLQRFANAELDGLMLPGFAALLETRSQASLFYLLKTDPALDCGDPNNSDDCFWSSTYVLP